MKDYYSILGVSPNVSQEVLDAVYKNLVKNQVDNIEEIKEAYKILSNTTMRGEYDERLKNKSDNSDIIEENADIIEFKYNTNTQYHNGKKTFAIIAIIMILIVVLLSLITSIDDSSKSPEISDSSPTVENYNDTNNLTDYHTESDSVGESETVSEIVTPEKYYIADGTTFSEGIAFIECTNGDVFAINTNGEKLFEIEDCNDLNVISEIRNGTFVYNDCLYNISGEIIASPQKSNFDNICYECNNYLIVEKLEESYKGDTKLYGVINNNGEWEIPLSPVGKWSYKKDFNTTELYYWEDDNINQSYDYKFGDPSFGYSFYEDGYVAYSNDYLNPYCHIFDKNGNFLVDITEYNGTDSIVSNIKNFDFSNGHIFFEAYNGTGNRYIFIMNTKGEFIVEPFKANDITEFWLNDKGFSYDCKNEYLFFDYDGNKIASSQKIFKLDGFNDGLSFAYRESDRCCYVNQKGEIVIE